MKDLKKVCHLTSVHSRYDGRIFRKECTSLAEAAYSVSLIVADGKGNEINNNITIYDVGKNKGRINRFIITTRKIKKLGIKLNNDIYHFHDPELLFVGLLLKKLGKKVIFDMHENVPADIAEKLYVPKFLRKILSFLYEIIEIYAVKRLDAIISTRKSINDRIKKYNDKIVLITNFPILEKSIQKKDNEKKSICFAGVVVPNWQHVNIIKAIEKKENMEYNLAGSINKNYKKQLEDLNGWKKVNYLGQIPFSQVQELYKKAYIGIAIYIYCKNMDGNYGNLANTKLFEYMNWGIPIICTDFTLWKKIIEEEEKCGICVNPYDINAIASAIEYLINNPKIAKQMGDNGRKAAINKYNWKTQENKLLNLYRSI